MLGVTKQLDAKFDRFITKTTNEQFLELMIASLEACRRDLFKTHRKIHQNRVTGNTIRDINQDNMNKLIRKQKAMLDKIERLENEVKEMRLFEPSQEIAEELNARIEEAVDQVDELKAGMSLFEMAPDSADVSTVAASDIGPGHNRSSIGSNRVSFGTVKGSTMDVFGACQDD